MNEYEGDFITTYRGKQFHYLKPAEGEIDIRDIAHALSLKCRFAGHCKVFYSVAEHSIRVADALPPELRLGGLLHDATEAYMPDIPRPIKESFGLREYEDTLMEVISRKYKFHPSNATIKETDNILIATEARDLMTNMDGWAELPEPLKDKIIPVSSWLAEIAFLARFNLYTGKVIGMD